LAHGKGRLSGSESILLLISVRKYMVGKRENQIDCSVALMDGQCINIPNTWLER
jgi:hypothetical protein